MVKPEPCDVKAFVSSRSSLFPATFSAIYAAPLVGGTSRPWDRFAKKTILATEGLRRKRLKRKLLYGEGDKTKARTATS